MGVEELIWNFVNAIFLSLVGIFSSQRARSRKKDILRGRLSKDGWKWRTLGSLCRSIREDEVPTKELLIEIGARASTKRKDVWTLGSSSE
jgi:hypothetical protein